MYMSEEVDRYNRITVRYALTANTQKGQKLSSASSLQFISLLQPVTQGNSCIELHLEKIRVVYSAVLAACATDGRGFEPRSGPNLDQKGLAAMLTSIQSVDVAHEVNLRITQGIHPGLETQGRHHQKSNRGVSVAHDKD